MVFRCDSSDGFRICSTHQVSAVPTLLLGCGFGGVGLVFRWCEVGWFQGCVVVDLSQIRLEVARLRQWRWLSGGGGTIEFCSVVVVVICGGGDAWWWWRRRWVVTKWCCGVVSCVMFGGARVVGGGRFASCWWLAWLKCRW